MKKIMIAPKCQYGYNTDYFQMANRLADKDIDVKVICFDQELTKMTAPKNVNVTYVKRTKSRAVNYIRYLMEIGKYSLKNRKELNWIVVSGTIELCGLLPFFLKLFTLDTYWIMDVRTCSVSPMKSKRRINDSLILVSTYFFDHITIISPLVAERLKIKKYEVLPLGADCYVDLTTKNFDRNNINFLYVGVFDERKIENIIRAFDIFKNRMKNGMESKLDIVGFSYKEDATKEVLEAISNATAKKHIIFHGRKSHSEIKELFQEATIGFSYVPVTDFFDVQPPTKTYEYIMNGIICVATNTRANAEIIDEKNGVLTEEKVASLYTDIESIVTNIHRYNSVEIAQTVKDSQWGNIMDKFYSFLMQVDPKKRRVINDAKQESV